MRVALLAVALLVSTVDAAPEKKAPAGAKKADKKAEPKKADAPPPAPRKPGPDDDKARALLDKLVSAPASRKATTEALAQIAPLAVDAIGEWIVRPHATDVDARRKVLAAIKAAVPDKSGRFNQPQRQSEKEFKADDAVDWLGQLTALEGSASPPDGIAEVIADDLAMQTLAATKDVRAAQLIFDAGFHAETMIYRDEVGRLLRRMTPYSIPALTRESQIGPGDRRGYATFQIERLDRQDAMKALNAAAGDESLQIAILATFRDTRHREAVHAVWTMVDNPAPKVRAMGREAFLAYIIGPPPPPAPRMYLKLPGGKKTKHPKPMYLTYRELADNELRKAAMELFNEDYPFADPQLDDGASSVKTVPIDLEAMTARIFKFYDERRAKVDGDAWAAAKKQADGGDLAGAVATLDRMIAENPERAQRAEMAQVYAAHAKQLEKDQKWADASVAFSKAHGLDPKGKTANDLLAGHFYALGQSLNAQGKNGDPDIRRAIALRPDYAPPAQAAEASRPASERPVWMLYAAAGSGGLAMLLFAAAMMRRRARAS
ncbi:MAG: hypothetical protein KF773_14890 [Deltaproteobacteria bacterium]|nr:hypothetical protein [Deltaproteobacteria bacterium]